MKFFIQRVAWAQVSKTEANDCPRQTILGEIKQGFQVMIGICQTDTIEIADKMVRKMIDLRIFEDADGKTNLSLKDVNGQLLLVSQFTLYANCKKGNRPSFIQAMDAEFAEKLYEYIIDACRHEALQIETGRFGADMQVLLQNDGPFSIMLDSKEMWDM